MPTKRATQAAQAVPFDSLEDMASHLQNSQQEMSNHEFQILMVKHMMKVEKSLEGLNPVKDELANHDKRIEALENKVGAITNCASKIDHLLLKDAKKASV